MTLVGRLVSSQCNSITLGEHRPLRADVSASVINKDKRISQEKKLIEFYREDVSLISSLLTKPRQSWSCPGLLSSSVLQSAHNACRGEVPQQELVLRITSQPADSRPPQRPLFTCSRSLGITLICWPRDLTSFLTRIIILNH